MRTSSINRITHWIVALLFLCMLPAVAAEARIRSCAFSDAFLKNADTDFKLFSEQDKGRFKVIRAERNAGKLRDGHVCIAAMTALSRVRTFEAQFAESCAQGNVIYGGKQKRSIAAARARFYSGQVRRFCK